MLLYTKCVKYRKATKNNVTDYLTNIDCEQGISAVHELVLSIVQFAFREQTLIHVNSSEAIFGFTTLLKCNFIPVKFFY